MNKSLRRDYLWNTIGVFLQNAISPLLLIAITHINGINVSGSFSFAFSVAIVSFAFGLWGGRTYQVSDARQEFPHGSYIAARFLLALAMVVGAIIFSVINGYDVSKSLLIIALVIFKAIESIADSIYGILQVHDDLSRVGRSLLYKSLGGFVFFVAIDLLTHDIFLSSCGIILANILFVVFYDVHIARKHENIRINLFLARQYSKDVIAIVRRTAAVFAVTFLATFSINIPRFFIDKYHGEQIGYFGIIAMPITLISLLMSFILQPNVMQITRLYEQKQYEEFKAVINKIMAVTIVLGLGILVGTFFLGAPLLGIVFGVDFVHYKNELMIMVAGGIANALVAIFITILTIIRQFRTQFYVLLVTNIVLVFISVIAVRPYGMVAGVLLFAATNLLQVFLLLRVYNSVVRRGVAARRADII